MKRNIGRPRAIYKLVYLRQYETQRAISCYRICSQITMVDIRIFLLVTKLKNNNQLYMHISGTLTQKKILQEAVESEAFMIYGIQYITIVQNLSNL